MSYTASVIILNDIVPHPNADRLNIARYNGEQFIIGKDIQVGDTVVIFPSDGQLSHEFCHFNNLYRHADKNHNPLKAGFFEDSRRVRAQPFRGVKSSGFLATLDMFTFSGQINLKAGDEFDEINGIKICNKYLTPKTLRAMNSNMQKKEKDVEYSLKEHVDSVKIAYRPPVINEPSLVIITEKVHGTSGRSGVVEVTRKNKNVIQKILNKLFGLNFRYTQYEPVSGTRRTIINNRLDVTTEGQQDYYRWEIHNEIVPQLHDGESVYYEVVGWDSNGGTIMDRQHLGQLKNQDEVSPTWNDPMIYSYGVPEGSHDIYVYRITRTTVDGAETELPWYQVVQRCRELGLKTVPHLHLFITNNEEEVMNIVGGYMDNRSSTLDDRHLMEGIVVRIENSEGTQFLKSKNELFGILEGYLKENDDYVDVEETN